MWTYYYRTWYIVGDHSVTFDNDDNGNDDDDNEEEGEEGSGGDNDDKDGGVGEDDGVDDKDVDAAGDSRDNWMLGVLWKRLREVIKQLEKRLNYLLLHDLQSPSFYLGTFSH